MPQNTADGIISASAELFASLTQANSIAAIDIAAIVFTVTPDLEAAFPAQAAQIAGFESVPRICAQEIDVPGGLASCLRILILWNTGRAACDVHHSYLNGAEVLTSKSHAAPSKLDEIESHFP